MILTRVRRALLLGLMGVSLIAVAAAPAAAYEGNFTDTDPKRETVRCNMDAERVLCVIVGQVPWTIPGDPPPPSRCPSGYKFPTFIVRNTGEVQLSNDCQLVIEDGKVLPFHKILGNGSIVCSGLAREIGIQCVNDQHRFEIARSHYTVS
ncbi:hypothetical protein F3087_29330 [Nocardia colli]|uniref:Uncharacterized protein n=1 Tax=Nocardia colli TaxID=2545717 RepID=A0A5N0E8J0_9NOCA|nr:hypothetical protein [Nocardia colli]KAA8885732.1 hypothetical protein F3087_29330 [Nocardia colli]